jgi:hypothetical protein
MTVSKKTIAALVVGDLREHCDEVRRFSGEEYRHLAEGSRELRAALAPHGRIKAWIVAAHLQLAARCAKEASGHAVACYLSYLRHFEVEIAAATKKAAKKKTPIPPTGGFRFGGK